MHDTSDAPDAGSAPLPVAGGESAPGPPLTATETPAPAGAGPVGHAVWWEVAAVLAVGVVPNLSSALSHLYDPLPSAPYWLDSFQLSVLSGCTILATLYMMSRSGESWETFGLGRPRVLDAPLGGLMLVVAAGVWCVLPRLPDLGVRSGDTFPRPHGVGECVLMVVKYALSAFAEELVTRAYLITRLAMLLRSRGEAVLVAAVLFASYHVYQGPSGAAYSLALGIAYGLAFLGLRRVWPLALGHALYNICLEIPLR